LTGLRAPNTNYPVEDVNSQDIICGQSGHRSSTILNVRAGDRIGTFWGHVIGGAQFPGDPDNPIARSHKGPIQVYLAKVDNAASASHTGLRWYVPGGRLILTKSVRVPTNWCKGSRFGQKVLTSAARDGALIP
jgi:Glycosyl hydrolase family 61.